MLIGDPKRVRARLVGERVHELRELLGARVVRAGGPARREAAAAVGLQEDDARVDDAAVAVRDDYVAAARDGNVSGQVEVDGLQLRAGRAGHAQRVEHAAVRGAEAVHGVVRVRRPDRRPVSAVCSPCGLRSTFPLALKERSSAPLRASKTTKKFEGRWPCAMITSSPTTVAARIEEIFGGIGERPAGQPGTSA